VQQLHKPKQIKALRGLFFCYSASAALFCTVRAPNFPHLIPQFMATPKKTAAGTWRIQIEVRGQRDAGTFDTRREAVEWAATRTAELKALAVGGKVGAKMLGQSRTLNDALKKYKEEVSPGKRGWRWEFVRIDAITTKHAAWPGKRLLVDLDAQDLIGWRDAA